MLVDNNFSRVINHLNLEVSQTIKKTHNRLVFLRPAFIDVVSRLSYILIVTLVGQLVFSLIKSLYV